MNRGCNTSNVMLLEITRTVPKFKQFSIFPGSRDRSILLWPTSAEGMELKPLAKYFDAHKGWVWSFCSQDDLLISGDWDSTMKFWTVGTRF